MLNANLAADFHSLACYDAFRHRSWSLTLFTCGAALNVGCKCSSLLRRARWLLLQHLLLFVAAILWTKLKHNNNVTKDGTFLDKQKQTSVDIHRLPPPE